jgi:5-dehydro-2-deoxygluconokinase
MRILTAAWAQAASGRAVRGKGGKAMTIAGDPAGQSLAERLAGGRFLVLGRAGMDLYADPPGTRVEEAERFTAALGGSAANIAAALVRQGCRADLITCVSDDAVGRYCRAALDGYGIGRAHVHTRGGEARNSLAVVETRAEDCQSVIYRNGAADFALTPADVAGVDYGAHAALVVTGTALAAEPSRGATLQALDLAQAAGLVRILDLDYRPYSWPSAAAAAAVYAAAAAGCDIVVGNDVEFGVLAGPGEDGPRAARGLIARGAALVVFKMGERGAITLTAGGETRSGIFRTRALKPTGAGDAFLGAMLAALAQGLPAETAVRRGSAAAAMVVARVGCAPAMPTTAELDAFLATAPAPAPTPDPAPATTPGA